MVHTSPPLYPSHEKPSRVEVESTDLSEPIAQILLGDTVWTKDSSLLCLHRAARKSGKFGPPQALVNCGRESTGLKKAYKLLVTQE